ncbi:DUF4974 domain-containing protein [Aggregatimonas sangjinii]|uniref:DUF4974 domain-containing protein n=1 Tax=Aggregatimonas sangjinii TaxID=2583587 RepID=A0A5B7SS46_9FLAO|nr:FecR domain-containing protein [Aggregatimonas sangjinii]QCX01032.1 DUF4974 domain-containing protein [Aggregatimonas sangjinii]
MQENYLAKWLNNELTEEELAEFKNSDEYATYKRIIEVSDTLQGPDFSAEEALSAIRNKRILEAPKVVQLHPFKRFMKVAAVAAILIVGAYFYLNTLDKTVSTEYAQRADVTLPDASEIALNVDSKVSFSENNWDEERKVRLEGEAFFKVAKGKKFTVATKAGDITVLGTQFNVEHRKDFFEVSCFEGLVSVSFKGMETEIPAGASFFAVNGKIKEHEIQKNSAPSWMNDESTFKSIPLRYVLDEFQRQHNIIVTTENIDTSQLYTGTFSNSDAMLALKSISVPSQIKFKFEGNKVLFYAEDAP